MAMVADLTSVHLIRRSRELIKQAHIRSEVSARLVKRATRRLLPLIRGGDGSPRIRRAPHCGHGFPFLPLHEEATTALEVRETIAPEFDGVFVSEVYRVQGQWGIAICVDCVLHHAD